MNMATGLSVIIFDTESNVVTDIFAEFGKIELEMRKVLLKMSRHRTRHQEVLSFA